MDKINKIKIKPNDNSIRSLGKVNIEWNNAVFELFNNSIQAAEDRDLDLKIDVDFHFTDADDASLNSVKIRDYSGGIKREDIQSALTPGARKSKKITLNEHGFGLNVALEFITQDQGDFQLISNVGEDSFLIDEPVSYTKDITLKEPEHIADSTGLEILFSNLSLSTSMEFPTRGQSKALGIWIEACKKYRYKYQQFVERGRSFDISFNYYCGDRELTRKFSPLAPVLINPVTGKKEWLTEFKLTDGALSVLFKLGVADEDKESYSYDLVNGNRAFYQIHPYRISHNTCGFETIYKDVIIESANLETIPIVNSSTGGNWAVISLLRGEMHILSGSRSVFTKDGVFNDRKLSSLIKKAINIFNGEEPHPKTKQKTDYMKDYVNRRNYSKDGIPAEKVLKYRHRQLFEVIGQKVRQEEANMYGIADMVVGNAILEHKRKETSVDDVLQLFKYVLAFYDNPKYSTYQLWAPKHSDGAISAADKINKNFLTSKKIELKKIPDALLNANLTDEEKELLVKSK